MKIKHLDLEEKLRKAKEISQKEPENRMNNEYIYGGYCTTNKKLGKDGNSIQDTCLITKTFALINVT